MTRPKTTSTAPGRAVKPHLTYEGQLELLASRGMHIENPDHARDALQRVSYYHLRGYTLDLTHPGTDTFRPGVTFDLVWNRYVCDRDLRRVVTAALGVVEHRLRNQVAYLLSGDFGPTGYTDPRHFRNAKHHQAFMRGVNTERRRSHEAFVAHHDAHYGGQLPAWVMVELCSFGALSKLVRNLAAPQQKELGRMLGVHHRPLDNMLHAMTVLRNIAAHHARLQGRVIHATCPVLKDDQHKLARLSAHFTPRTRMVFPVLLATSRLLPPTERDAFAQDVAAVCAAGPPGVLASLGAPAQLAEALGGAPDVVDVRGVCSSAR